MRDACEREYGIPQQTVLSGGRKGVYCKKLFVAIIVFAVPFAAAVRAPILSPSHRPPWKRTFVIPFFVRRSERFSASRLVLQNTALRLSSADRKEERECLTN